MSGRTSMGGHEIYYDEATDQWRYKDNNEPTLPFNERPCVRCGKPPTDDGHDSCIANLGYVVNACCGHGVEKGYIQFDDGTIITGDFKIERNIEYGKVYTEYLEVEEMQTLHIAELIDKTIDKVIFGEWNHEGYMDGWNSEQVCAVIDGGVVS